jgi:hypothetical protein
MKTVDLTEKKLENAIKTGYVFVRCIPYTGYSVQYNERAIDVEIRKISRIKGSPSLTKTKANTHGYPCASCSLIGKKTATFDTVGYGIINPPWEDIMSVSHQNAGTGGHKKTEPLEKNLMLELKALKKFVDLGGNENSNNEVEINIHTKTPISFVFAYPGKEIYATVFKEKFKNAMEIDLPVYTYTAKNYPKFYQNAKNDIISSIPNQLKNIDYLVTVFDYYKDHKGVINILKSSLNLNTLSNYLTGNMHVSNFRNTVKLADQLDLILDSRFKGKVSDFLNNLNKYASFDKENQKFQKICSHKSTDEVIEFLRHWKTDLLKHSTNNQMHKLVLNKKLSQDRKTLFLKNLLPTLPKQKDKTLEI